MKGKPLMEVFAEQDRQERNLLTTAQAATWLGVSRRRVQQYVNTGALPASRMGRDWMVTEAAVRRFRRRPTGRPRLRLAG